ncbi:MAG: fumarylacetoacetase [Phycisphaerales bacterium]|nr:fumarylacetoacetase [Phycisphaerales bacterium]MCB9835553.1 fumarylacetoacetase [Phycisphaera sp.]
MPYEIDETHDPKLESWVESANDPATDFPIQNLPLCDFTGTIGDQQDRKLAVRIGEKLFLLDKALEAGLFPSLPSDLDGTFWAGFTGNRDVYSIYELESGVRKELRRRLSELLGTTCDDLRGNPELIDRVLIDAAAADFYWPPSAFDYTDFYASVYHATNVGSMFRPDNPLLPNYKWIPVGYHGRASSVVPSGTPVRRPTGQLSPAEEGGAPGFGPCKMLDYELELGVVVGRGNELGQPIPIGEAEDHILGMCLLNDWSARDMQKWEYVPLGPFLAKNFATTVSPYIVTMEALAPFRSPAMVRPDGDPKPLPHLFDERDQAHGGIDITLEVFLASKQMRDKKMDPIRLSKGTFKDMYWTIAQMLTHHSSNGCNMQPGDLLGSGTISGPTREARGCLLELTWDGDPFANPPKLVPGTERTPIKLPTGEERKFIADGDEVIIRGYCEREGFRRIGFGECRGIIEPAIG